MEKSSVPGWLKNLEFWTSISVFMMSGDFYLIFFKVANVLKYSSSDKSRHAFSSYTAGRATPLESSHSYFSPSKTLKSIVCKPSADGGLFFIWKVDIKCDIMSPKLYYYLAVPFRKSPQSIFFTLYPKKTDKKPEISVYSSVGTRK